jgi:hypothetical protein
VGLIGKRLKQTRYQFHESRIELFAFFADRDFVVFPVKISSSSRSRPCQSNHRLPKTVRLVMIPQSNAKPLNKLYFIIKQLHRLPGNFIVRRSRLPIG